MWFSGFEVAQAGTYEVSLTLKSINPVGGALYGYNNMYLGYLNPSMPNAAFDTNVNYCYNNGAGDGGVATITQTFSLEQGATLVWYANNIGVNWTVQLDNLTFKRIA